MISKRLTISLPFRERVKNARDIYREFGKDLLETPKIDRLLGQLKEATLASREEMGQTGIVEICRRCDQLEGGSCCGAGLENRYDGWLLLINLLLGADIPFKRHDEKSCFLLGEKGCLLVSRHVICINYLCGKITRRIPPDHLKELRELEGRELETLFLLKESLRTFMKQCKTG
ncbi:MAG: hypothetical protein WCB49_04745 [Gammaproteobacteria bacterium]